MKEVAAKKEVAAQWEALGDRKKRNKRKIKCKRKAKGRKFPTPPGDNKNVACSMLQNFNGVV